MPISSPDLVTPQILDQLKPLLGNSTVVIINHLDLATNGGIIIRDSIINHYIESIRTEAPEIANQIQDGLKYSKIEKSLQVLAKELSELKNSPPAEKQSKFKKARSILDDIRRVSFINSELMPYAKQLYSFSKPFIETHTGFALPDWQ